MQPLGPIAGAQDALRLTLAACPTWQALCDASDATEALRRVHTVGLPPPIDGSEYSLDELTALRPFAIVATSKQRGFLARADAAYGFNHSGRLDVQIEMGIRDELLADPDEAEREFLNTLGQIVTELCEQCSGLDTHLSALQSIELASGPFREHPTEKPAKGESYWAILEIAWGVE
jgi:hypothetical protein